MLAVGATANLTMPSVTVAPGAEVRCPILVRNTGDIVDQFTFEVLGPAAAWATVEPASISLFPGAAETVQLCFRPLRTADTTAGPVPFGVKILPREDPTGTVVEEGEVEVGSFVDSFAEIIPRSGRGRRSARFEVAVDNRGNRRLNAQLSAVDDLGTLMYAFSTPGLLVDPGTAAFASVRVRPRATFLRGAPRSHVFKVVVESDAGDVLTADGTLLQEPLVPKWLWKALLLLLLLVVALVVLWFTLLKPIVRSTAKAAVAKPVKDAQAAADAAKKAQAGAEQSAAGAGQNAKDAQVAAGKPVTAGTPVGGAGGAQVGVVAGQPLDGRLVLTQAGTTAFAVPAGKTLQVTDIVMENPKGNTGTVSVQRSGSPLLVLALDNFRDLDYHFVSPIIIPAGKALELKGECTSADCTPGLYYLGILSGS